MTTGAAVLDFPIARPERCDDDLRYSRVVIERRMDVGLNGPEDVAALRRTLATIHAVADLSRQLPATQLTWPRRAANWPTSLRNSPILRSTPACL